MKTIQATAAEADHSMKSIKSLLETDLVKAFTEHLNRFSLDDIEYACVFYPGETLEFAAKLLTPEQFNYCCQRDTRIGLAYFGEIMEDQLFATSLKYNPRTALSYQSERLTKEQFARCVKEHPGVVLSNPSCHHRLSIKQLYYCIRRCPAVALECAGWLLTDAQFDYCCRRAPFEAMQNCAPRLAGKMLRFCCLSSPRDAFILLLDRMGSRLLDECCRLDPAAALAYATRRMTYVRFQDCVRQEPWTAMLLVPGLIESNQLVRLASDHAEQIDEYLREYPDSKLFRGLVPLIDQLDDPVKHVVSAAIVRGI